MSLVTRRSRSFLDLDLYRRYESPLRSWSRWGWYDSFYHCYPRYFSYYREPSTVKVVKTVQKQPDTHRIVLDCKEYAAESIKVNVSDGGKKVVVIGNYTDRALDGDYFRREFRKSFTLPPNADILGLSHKLESNGDLVIEVPIKSEETRIVEYKHTTDYLDPFFYFDDYLYRDIYY